MKKDDSELKLPRSGDKSTKRTLEELQKMQELEERYMMEREAERLTEAEIVKALSLNKGSNKELLETIKKALSENDEQEPQGERRAPQVDERPGGLRRRSDMVRSLGDKDRSLVFQSGERDYAVAFDAFIKIAAATMVFFFLYANIGDSISSKITIAVIYSIFLVSTVISVKLENASNEW